MLTDSRYAEALMKGKAMVRRSKNKNSKLPARVFAGLFLSAAFLSGYTLFQEFEAQNLKPENLKALKANSVLPKDKSPSYYTAIANLALSAPVPDYDLADKASRKLINLNFYDIPAWNRLAFIERRKNGYITRDSITALYKSFQLSPYGDLDMMIWRVEFASANWSSITTDLQEQVLRQIPIIGRFGTSWEWRIDHCKNNPHKALYDAICDIAPGVNRPNSGSAELR